MDIQQCANGVTLLPLGKDPQAEMISACIKFQASLGLFDERISDHPSHPYVQIRRAIHQLDMGRQECAEAWDLLEGGWKHHKRKPRDPDRGELVMELVDIATFAFNAYIYMGGQPEAELVAACVNRSDQRVKMGKLGLNEAWDIGERTWRVNGVPLTKTYGHGDGAHGEEWVKNVATRVNYLASKLSACVETLRTVVQEYPDAADDGSIMPASGFVYIEVLPMVYGAMAALPEGSRQEFYSSFMHKNKINFDRQTKGY